MNNNFLTNDQIFNKMTIPSRPAPPPPVPSTSQQNGGGQQRITIKLPPPHNSIDGCRSSQNFGQKSLTNISSNINSTNRYAPATNWNGTPFNNIQNNYSAKPKKPPPPRPPPPKIQAGNTVLKKPGPPQSINVLSNFFGRKKPTNTTVKKSQYPPKIPPLPISISTQNFKSTNNNGTDGDLQLITFDSPPSSPTLTQKSNSDCVSVDSFSSDSNFSSPNNGNASQPESGFEDDFASPADPWETIIHDPFGDTKILPNDIGINQNVRNIHAINKIQPFDTLNNGKSLLPPPPTLAMPTIIKPKPTLNSRNTSPTISVLTKNSTNKLTNVYPTKVETNLGALDDFSPSLPMPNCPPPPPPQVNCPVPPPHVSDILDVISGKLDAMDLVKDNTDVDEESYGIALYDFEGVEEADLSFKVNEKIYLLQRLNEEWYLGRNKRGCEGMFPANYIEVKVPLKEEQGAMGAQTDKQNTNRNQPSPSIGSYPYVRALYTFKTEFPEDLSLNENDMVKVIYRINDEWLYGEVGGRKGQFPANFIEYVPSNLTQMP